MRTALKMMMVLLAMGVSTVAVAIDENLPTTHDPQLTTVVPDDRRPTTDDAVNSVVPDRIPEAVIVKSPVTSDIAQARDARRETRDGTTMPWGRMAVAFVFVASLILSIGTIVRRVMGGGRTEDGRRVAPPLQILQTLPIGMKRQLMVVNFEGTKLVLGLSGTAMQCLHVAETSSRVSRLASRAENEQSAVLNAPVPTATQPTAHDATAAVSETRDARHETRDAVNDDITSQIRRTISALGPLYSPNIGRE